MPMRTWIGRSLAMSLAVGAVAAAGCAGKRGPTPRVETAAVAIRGAERSGGAQYAPLELRLAREKLDKARRALDDDKHDEAWRLSEEALADAQLAEAKANSEKARRNAEEVRQSIQALRSEATRPLEER
jgi:hypothetical protein